MVAKLYVGAIGCVIFLCGAMAFVVPFVLWARARGYL